MYKCQLHVSLLLRLSLASPSIIGNQQRQDGDDHGNSLLLAVLICTFISIYSDILARTLPISM